MSQEQAHATILVNQASLSSMLRMFRERMALSPRDVAKEMSKSISKLTREEMRRSKLCNRSDLTNDWPSSEIVTIIEMRSEGFLELDPVDLQLIANAYDVPRLMLDPLCAEQVDALCNVEGRESFICPGPKPYGNGASYSVPGRRLIGTEEIAFVRLVLDPKATSEDAYSDVHSHPGDELLFVLDGSVEVRLHESGIWNRLDKYDYIHFYSEQEHSAWRVGEAAAEVFIIRFYQLRGSGTRSEVAKGIFAFLKEAFAATRKGTKRSLSLIWRLAEEIRLSMTPAPSKSKRQEQAPVEHREIVDRYGLGRLLRFSWIELTRTGHNAVELAKKAKKLGFTRSKLDRIHHGMAPVTGQQLRALAEIHDVPPMILFDFFYPTVRGAAVVRRESRKEKADWEKVPPSFLNGSKADYYVPTRRLTDSDITIAWVELAKGESTPANRHAGQELAVVLQGVIEVQFTSSKKPFRISAADKEIAHYQSTHTHQLTNVGSETAIVFVVRFLEHR